ncbi:MAG: phosphotyrosine protein phosphatase [Porticoccaceae bacterium]|nr:MAG: phosphotyrosine protein phosphatase [Porticoccaceae bacterium]
MKPVGVLFVCLGNICRSPTAEGVFERLAAEAGLAHRLRVDSAGTGPWHVGKPPDPRAVAAARARGYEIGHLRARQVEPADFERFDYLLAMDRHNLAALEAFKPPGFTGHLGLFLDFAGVRGLEEVPDPYGGGPAGFERVLDLIERGAEGLLRHLRHHDLR